MKKSLLLPLLALTLLLAPDGAVAAPDERPVTIESDRIASGADGEVLAIGNVTVVDGAKTLRGDRARFNRDTRTGRIEGNVRYTEPAGTMTADAVDFDAGTGLGTLWRARGLLGEYYTLAGEKVVRAAPERYLVDDGFLTTCDCDQGDPDWAFSASHIDLTLEEYATFDHLLVEVKGTPVFWLPWFVAPVKTKRATGFLVPGFGVSSADGFQMTNRFFWAFAENADATISHQYLGDAGNRVGGEIRYLLTPDDAGQFTAEYLAAHATDRQDAGSAWKVYGDHRSLLPGAVDALLHLDKESDRPIDRLYAEDIADRTRRYTDSSLTFSRAWGPRTVRLTGREYRTVVDVNRQTLTVQPSLVFTNQLQPLFGSSVYGALESSYTSYRDERTTATADTLFEVNRFDLSPSVSLPLPVAPWLSLTPKAGYRLTHYSRGNESDPEQASTAFTRDYYYAGLNVTGPKLFRLFETGAESRPLMKHLIVPSVDYLYIPSYDSHDGEDRRRVKVIDAIDRAGGPANLVTFRLTNQLLVKEIAGAGATTQTPLQLILSQGYDLNEADRELTGPTDENRPLQPLTLDLGTRPFPWLMINYISAYDHYEKAEAASRLEVGFRYDDRFHFALDRTFKRGKGAADDTVWDTLYAEVNTPWRVSVDYSLVANETTGEVADSALRGFYRRDCWEFGLALRRRLVETDDGAGGKRLDEETVTTFSVTLRGIGDALGAPQLAVAGRKL